MTQAQRDELRQLAKSATPGPWSIAHGNNNGSIYIADRNGGFIAKIWMDRNRADQNADFLASVSPSFVMDLLDQVSLATAQANLINTENQRMREMLRKVAENISYEPLNAGCSEEGQMRAEGDIILEGMHREIEDFLEGR